MTSSDFSLPDKLPLRRKSYCSAAKYAVKISYQQSGFYQSRMKRNKGLVLLLTPYTLHLMPYALRLLPDFYLILNTLEILKPR